VSLNSNSRAGLSPSRQGSRPRTAPGCSTYVAVFRTQQRQAVSGQGHDHVALLSRPVDDHLVVGVIEADLQRQGKGHPEPPTMTVGEQRPACTAPARKDTVWGNSGTPGAEVKQPRRQTAERDRASGSLDLGGPGACRWARLGRAQLQPRALKCHGTARDGRRGPQGFILPTASAAVPSSRSYLSHQEPPPHPISSAAEKAGSRLS